MTDPKPEIGLNAWGARAHALEEARMLVHQHFPESKTKAAVVAELARQCALAASRANSPMRSPAEHLARKVVASYRAAIAVWRGA